MKPMKPGTIVYAKKVKSGLKENRLEYTFSGHGVCVLLGHVKKDGIAPSVDHCKLLISNLGWIFLDDIAEILGENEYQKFQTRLNERLLKLNKELANGQEKTAEKEI